MAIDARTTPPWLRPVQLVFLGLMAVAWFDASFHALDQPSFRQYLMGWKMFTVKRSHGIDHRAMVQWTADGPYEPIDLPRYFPTRWDSGYRYSLFRGKRTMRIIAGALCHRLEEPAYAVKIYQVTWPLEPGSTRRAESRETLMSRHRCDNPVQLVGGRTQPLHPRQGEVR